MKMATPEPPPGPPPVGARPPGLIKRYREELQARHYARHYARRTVDTYPPEMGSEEVNASLTHLAVEGQVSASTQNQALSALLFLYRVLLERDLDLEGVVRARKPRRLPVVLTEEEVRSVLQQLEGSEVLVAGLLYGSGLRLMEALRLRVQDLDFNRQELTVRNGKGGSDRRTMLPKRLPLCRRDQPAPSLPYRTPWSIASVGREHGLGWVLSTECVHLSRVTVSGPSGGCLGGIRLRPLSIFDSVKARQQGGSF